MTRKTNKKLHTFFGIAAAFLLAVVFVFSAISPLYLVANAADGHNDYDGTDILEDLSDIDPLKYPANSKGTPEIIRVQEYCYSEKVFYTEYFGLYIYLYNPNCKPLNETKCTVTLANEYSYNANGELAPSSFETRTLKFLDSAYENRFYKFKIAGDDLLTQARGTAAANNGTRRYDFTDIKLRYADNTTVNTAELDRRFSKTYYFSGYGEGLHASSEKASTLRAEVGVLETIVLNVKQASYRSAEINSDTHKNMTLDTAYFAVEEKYFQDYGALQKINAEWYEYKTKPIFVTSDSSAFAALYDYIGKDADKNLEWRVLWEEENITEKPNPSWGLQDIGETVFFGKTYNGRFGQFSNGFYTETSNSGALEYYSTENSENISRIDWLFDAGEVETTEDYTISAEKIKDYMTWYSTTLSPTSSRTEDGKYSLNLFEESIDEERIELLKNPNAKRGYVNVKQDIGSKLSFWDYTETEEKKFLFFKWYVDWYGSIELDPIIVLTSNDLEGLTAETFAKKYYIGETYQDDCFNYCKTATENGNRAVLYRFASTEYYASAARFDKDGNGMSDKDGYVAQMTVFTDFDVISLTFRDENKVDTVIGVVSTPIDIINGIEAGDDLTVAPKTELIDWDWQGLFDLSFSSVKNSLKTLLVVLVGGALALVLFVWTVRGFFALVRALLRKR